MTIRVRSVPAESNARASSGDSNLRCIRSTSRSPDLSSNSSESTCVSSSDSEFVRSSLIILLHRPGSGLSLSSGLSLPNTTDHLFIGDRVLSSSSNVTVSVEVIHVSIDRLPVNGERSLRNFSDGKSSDGLSLGLNVEEGGSYCGSRASLVVASISSGLDEISSSEEKGAGHQSGHGDSASVLSVESSLVVDRVKGLVAVSILFKRSPLFESLTSSESIVSSANANIIAINIITSIVKRGRPCEDSRALKSSNSECRRVGKRNSSD